MNNIALNIKRIEQEDDFDCSLACVGMIMNFYGDKISVKELQGEMLKYVNKDERHIEASTIFLLEQKYKVFFQNYNLKVLGDNLINLTEKDVKEFQSEFDNLNNEESFRKTKLNLTVEYINKGGVLSTNKPKLDLIEENLNKGIPVIVGVNNAELRQNPNAKYNHYIVVSGIRNNKFIITDPSPNFPEPYEVDKNILEKAWYAMGAYVLVVGVSKS